MNKLVKGFSKLNKQEKKQWLIDQYLLKDKTTETILNQYNLSDNTLQKLHDDFIENAIGNFISPYAIAPNFMINGALHAIPMVTEESSVVASVGKTAKFWLTRGGFKTKVIGTEKTGQVHFKFDGTTNDLEKFFAQKKNTLIASTQKITANMEARGGGLLDIILVDKSQEMEHYYQLHGSFETLDAMGANFINSCLEKLAKTFQELANNYPPFIEKGNRTEIIMSILSNYNPLCRAYAEVSCPIDSLNEDSLPPKDFAQKFLDAITIARITKERAVTHNKGIMNGIDAVTIATGNDFRAIESGIHAYACNNGSYRSLSEVSLEGDIFKFWLDIPLSVGTVGGVTKLHPLANLSLDILGNPSARELMQIIATVGLAQNFAAVRSLITTGIQKGHMKMHLNNILNTLGATESEKENVKTYFEGKIISFKDTENYLQSIR